MDNIPQQPTPYELFKHLTKGLKDPQRFKEIMNAMAASTLPDKPEGLSVDQLAEMLDNTIIDLFKLRGRLEMLELYFEKLQDPKKEQAKSGMQVKSATYNKITKTLTMADTKASEMHPGYLKYLLESLGLPADTTVVFEE